MKLTSIHGAVVVGLLLVGCGPKLQQVSSSQKDQTDTNEGRRETVTISVGLEEGNAAGLSLTAASSYTMSMDGCASGLSYATITQANPNIDVYKFDRGCKVKLSSFQVGGINYILDNNDLFDSWTTGDIATFQDEANNATKIRVVVTSQLNDPVTGTEAVSYTFSQIVKGADETLAKTIVSDAHSLSVAGQDATAYTIKAVSLTGMTIGGAGQFVFTLECPQNVAGTAPALTCDGVALSDVKYRLVADTYAGTLNLTQAAALFAGSESTVADADKLGVAEGGTTRGGFKTKTGASALTGPNQMHLNPNMLLVVQIGGTSYRYFNVDVTTLTL
jgi:hypothetical protein